MLPATLSRLFARAAMLSGIFIIIKKTFVELLLPLNAATNIVGTLGLLFGFFALTGIYFHQRDASHEQGLISYLVIWFGLGLVAGADYAKNYIFLYMSTSELQALLAGPTRWVLLSSALIFMIGVIYFSIVALYARVFPRPAVLLFMIGFTLFSLASFVPDIVVRTGQVLGATGVIWLGYTMWISLRKTVPTMQAGQSASA